MRQTVKAVEARLAEEKVRADQDRKALLGKLEEEGRSGTTQVREQRAESGVAEWSHGGMWRRLACVTDGMCDDRC